MSDILSFFGVSNQSNLNKSKPNDKAKASKNQKSSPKSKSKSESNKTPKATLPTPLPKPKSKFEYIDKSKSQHTDTPPNAGQVEIPIGSPNCLQGIVFTASGTLNSITRKQIREIITQYGGKLISKVLPADIFIRGVKDVSREKLEEARDNEKTIIDEEGFFYILRKSLNPDEEEKPQEIKNKTVQEHFQIPEPVAPPPPPPKPMSKPKIDTSALLIPDSCPSHFSSQEDDDNYVGSQPIPNNEVIPEKSVSTLFTEKYRPKVFSDLVGNQDGVQQIRRFLKNFDKQEKKSILIYGPPGIGKTTSAIIAAESAGYHILEFNASDTRNSKSVEKHIFNNQTLFKYRNQISSNIRTCIIFDEVDGMSAGDRGGIQALTECIKSSRIPIICICNDGYNKKLQTLKKYAIEIPFKPPTAVEMAERLSNICKAENIQMNRKKYIAITQKAQGDMRSALNNLQLWSSGVEDSSEKDIQIGDVYQAVFTLFKPKTEFEKKMDCFFVDYNSMPAYVHHYCTINDRSKDKNRIHTWFESIDSMAYGNEIESVILKDNSWDLLNPLAVVSSIIPATLCPKFTTPNRAFPEDFIKSKKQTSAYQDLKDVSIKCHRNCGSGTSNAFRDTTADLIVMQFNSLIENKQDEDAVNFLDQLELTKDDLISLQNITGNFNGFADPNSSTFKFSEKENKSFVQLYKQNHPELKKDYKSNEDERADFYIRTFSKRKTPKK